MLLPRTLSAPGTASSETLGIELNRINQALISIIDKLPPHLAAAAKGNAAGAPPQQIIQHADKIYNINKIDNANFS